MHSTVLYKHDRRLSHGALSGQSRLRYSLRVQWAEISRCSVRSGSVLVHLINIDRRHGFWDASEMEGGKEQGSHGSPPAPPIAWGHRTSCSNSGEFAPTAGGDVW